MVDRSGKPDERNSSNAQIRTILEEQRQTIIAEYREKSVITNSKQLTQKKSANSTKTIMETEIGISWSSSTKSNRNGRITEIPEFYLRYDRETKTHRGSEHYFGIISISNDSRQDHGYHLLIARMRWTSSRRNIIWSSSENGRCSQIIENSQIGLSRHLDSSTTTQMAKIMVQYGRPSCSSWTEFVRLTFGRTIMGKAIWENPIETWLGEDSKLGMSLYIVKKDYSYLCMWMT